jgi:hypothetical protein
VLAAKSKGDLFCHLLGEFMKRAIQKRSIVTLLVAVAASLTVRAATILTTTPSTISSIDSYASFGGGDVILTLATNSLVSACPFGFWIRATDAGAKTVVAQAIAAYQAGSTVTVSADASTVWSGAGSAACLVWDIRGS